MAIGGMAERCPARSAEATGTNGSLSSGASRIGRCSLVDTARGPRRPVTEEQHNDRAWRPRSANVPVGAARATSPGRAWWQRDRQPRLLKWRSGPTRLVCGSRGRSRLAEIPPERAHCLNRCRCCARGCSSSPCSRCPLWYAMRRRQCCRGRCCRHRLGRRRRRPSSRRWCSWTACCRS